MKRLPVPLRALVLSVIFFPIIHALPSNRSIIPRADTCSAAGLKSCGAGLPDNFCCDASSTCIPLAGGTTALCCPSDHECIRVEPIVCNIETQDPEKGLNAPLKTTALDATLPSCGKNCCPFGYTCTEDHQCEMLKDQTIAPDKSEDGPSGSATTTATQVIGTATSSPRASTAAAGADPSKKKTEDGETPKPFPTGKVVAGVISGVFALILLVGGIMFYKARKNKSNMSTASSDSWGNKIVVSQPMVDERSGSLGRTDFLLKRPGSSSTGTTRGERLSNIQRPDSMGTTEHVQRPAGPLSTPISASEAVFDGRVGGSVPPIRGMNKSGIKPQKPRLERGPSQESIRIALEYPADRRMTTATTFTELMQEVDLGPVHKGHPYLGTPPMPRTPPRR